MAPSTARHSRRRIILSVSILAGLFAGNEGLRAEDSVGTQVNQAAGQPPAAETAAPTAPAPEASAPPPAATAGEAPTAGTGEAAVDPDAEPPRRKKKKKRGRRIASSEDGSRYSEMRVRNPYHTNGTPYELRLAGLAGLSYTTPTTAEASYTNFLLSLNADFRLYKYVGAEVDVYGDLITAKYQGSGASGPKEAKQTYGGSIALKGQYPFAIQSVWFVPKVGVGYGLHKVERSSTPANSADVVVSDKTSGIFFLVGLDVEATATLLFFADFAMSLGATGERQTGTATAATDLKGASFSRFRLGGVYRFAPHWGLGGQFVLRSTTSDNQTTNNTPTQFLGLLMYEL